MTTIFHILDLSSVINSLIVIIKFFLVGFKLN